MKNFINLFGIIALAVVVMFGFIACDDTISSTTEPTEPTEHEIAASNFKDDHSEALELDVADVEIGHEAIVNAALDAHDALHPNVKALITAEKEKLDSLKAAIEAKKALLPTLESISASYTQGATVVYTATPLNNLKTGLTVTAHYSDSSSDTVAADDYTLSGTLTVGESTVTVSYGGKSDTFNVTVLADGEAIMYWGNVNSLTATKAGYFRNAVLNSTSINMDLPNYNESSTQGIRSGVITLAGRSITFNKSGIRTILVPMSLGPLTGIRDAINNNAINSFSRTDNISVDDEMYYLYEESDSADVNMPVTVTLQYQSN